MIQAMYENGVITPLTETDRREMDKFFPDGNIVLNSDNCPQLAAEIEKQSAILLAQNRQAYEVLARYD